MPLRRVRCGFAFQGGHDRVGRLGLTQLFANLRTPQQARDPGKGAQVFRDPNQADRVWVIFDWNAEGWQSFVSDPETPVVLKGAGHTSKPSSIELAATCDA